MIESDFSENCLRHLEEISGERGLFTADPPYFFCISSGSAGKQKYLPLTRREAELQHIYWDGAIRAIIRRDLSHYSEKDLFGNIFLMSDTFLTSMPDGMMNGVRSGLSARMQYNEGTYPYELFYAPKEILFPDELLDILFCSLHRRECSAWHRELVRWTPTS